MAETKEYIPRSEVVAPQNEVVAPHSEAVAPPSLIVPRAEQIQPGSVFSMIDPAVSRIFHEGEMFSFDEAFFGDSEHSYESDFGEPRPLKLKRAERPRTEHTHESFSGSKSPFGPIEWRVDAAGSPVRADIRRVLHRERFYGKNFRPPPRVTYGGGSIFVRYDVSFGCKFITDNMDISNKAVRGCLDHMSFGEMFPFIYMVNRGLAACASDYWDMLAASFPRFRIRGVFKNLYRFIRYNRSLRGLVEDVSTFPESLHAIAYSEQFIIKWGEENISKVASTFVEAENVRLAPEYRPPTFEEVSEREFDLVSYLEGLQTELDSQAVDELQGRRKRNPYGDDHRYLERDINNLSADIADQKNILKAYGLKMLDSLIHLHAIYKFLSHREWAGAIGQVYLMIKDKLGVFDRAKGMYNAWADLRDMRRWKGELNEMFVEHAAELETEMNEVEAEGEVEVLLGGNPVDFFGAFGKSVVWRKLMALVAAMSAPDILHKFPGFTTSVVSAFANGVYTITASSTLVQSSIGFFATFLDRVKVAWEEKSFWAFLREGGYETFLIRGSDLAVASVKGIGAYVSISSLIEDMDIFIAEGKKYILEDSSRSPTNCRMKPEHHRILQQVVSKRANWFKRMHAMGNRKKEPISFGFVGPPGIGKTSRIQEIATFVVRHSEGRIAGPGGRIELNAGDAYNVPPRDKHWNNCTNPRLLNFNDIPGGGYVNNGTMINMPDMMRLAVDVEPFYTPQADLDSKADNAIDPDVVTFTTNAMMLHFSAFGNDWDKLLRRYPNLYYLAYPATLYSEDIGAGNGHGILKDPKQKITPEIAKDIRVFRMRAVHLAGDITFQRTTQLEGGVKEMMLEIKKSYLAHQGAVGYSLDAERRCNNLTPWDDHDGHCLPGCDWIAPEPLAEAAEVRELSPHEVAITQGVNFSCCKRTMDNIADSQFRRIVDIYKARVYRKFVEMRSLVREYIVEISIGVAGLVVAWGVGSAIKGAVDHRNEVRKSFKTPGELWDLNARPVSAMTIEGNVINPMTHETPASYAVRFGLKEAAAREMPNPPKFPSNTRQHIFLSPASATSDAEDVRRLVRSNSYVFESTDHTGVGVFIDSTTLLMNTHVWKDFTGQVKIRRELDNGLKFFSDLSQAVHDDVDLTLIRVPSFPAANLWKHIPNSTGRTCDISVGAADWEPAVRKAISFGEHLHRKTEICWTYATPGVAGDCGTPGVGRINGKGVWLSYHVALLANGEGAGLCMGPHVKLLASKLPPAPGQVVVRPFVDSVESLHAQSKMRSANGVSMAILGTFETGKSNARSRLAPTEFNDLAKAEMREEKVIPNLQIDGIMGPDGEWKAPYVHKWKGLAFEPKGVRTEELKRAVMDYLSGRPIDKLHPLTLEQAIKGVVGDPMLKTMNFATSAGSLQRFYGGKRYVLDAEHISAELHAAYWSYVELLVDNVVAEHQKWCLKDELVTRAKENAKKYRYFMVSDLPNLIAFRMFVAPLVAHMYRNKEFFEAYGAFNPASPDFGKLMDRLRKFALLLMADIKHMDSSHKAYVAEAVAEVFVQVAKDGGGYNEESLAVVRNLVVGVVFSLVELNGDLAFISEGMGSGVYVTFIFNCIVLSIMYRVAWFRVSTKTFREHNVLVCGGDDSAATTDNPKFTGVHIQETFADYGYELTPPTAKDGLMVDFFPFDEMVFLKRRPSHCRWKEVRIEVGALDTDSIWRSIGWTNTDVAVSQSDRMAQVLDAAQREFALHGEEDFERFHRLIGKKAIFRRLTYDEVIERYVANKLYEDIEQYELESCLVQRVYGHSKENKDRSLAREHYILWGVEQIREAEQGRTGGTALAKGVFTPTLRFAHVPEPNWKAKPWNAKAQTHSANFIGNDNEITTVEQVVTFEMASAESSGVAPTPHDAVYALPSGEVAIQDTLKRPVYLGTITWTTLTSPVNTFGSVYDLWRADSMVDSKLFGYKFWRGKPTLRFVVNGMSTNYGKLVLAVDLNPGQDGESLFNGRNPKVNSYGMENVCQAMQTSHIAIDPSESCTYDYPIPWYSATGWYNRFNANVTPVVTLKYFVCNQLDSVSAVAAPAVTVQVYLMMEDLELSVPAVAAILGKKKSTKTAAGVTTTVAPMEASPGGTLSKGLSSLGAASGMLSSIPALTPFLGPFSVGMGMASKVAGALGYSAPRAVEESYEVLNRVVSPAQYTDGRQGITVLAGDPKQSVAFSAEACGVGDDDDMLISKIVSKFGLVDQAPWSPADGAGTSIMALAVNPSLTFAVAAPWVQHTPLSWLSNVFTWWSGSLVYRIEIVVSGFHRGAIGVSWVPYDDPPGGSVLNYPNRYLTKIIDVTETKVVDMVIPYAGDTVFSNKSTNNGVLRFYVVNPLVTTGSNASVGINVYVAGGADFELYRPNSSNMASVTPIPVAAVQSSKKKAEGEREDDVSTVVVPIPNLKMLSFGEGFTSIKQLCNRHCVVSTYLTSATTSGTMTMISWPRGGLVPRINAGNSFLNDFSNYFSYAFLAERGGRRWKFCHDFYTPTNSACNRAEAWLSTRLPSVAPMLNTNTFPSSATCEFNQMRLGNGVHLDSTSIHPFLEFETPYIGVCQFVNPRKPVNKGYGAFGTTLTDQCINVNIAVQTGSASSTFQLFGAAADDFSLHGFFYVPQLRPITNT